MSGRGYDLNSRGKILYRQQILFSDKSDYLVNKSPHTKNPRFIPYQKNQKQNFKNSKKIIFSGKAFIFCQKIIKMLTGENPLAW